MSQIATTVMPGTVSICFSRNEPRLPTPMKATRIVSFGDWPFTRRDDPSEATLALRNERRLSSIMPLILSCAARPEVLPRIPGALYVSARYNVSVDRGAILAALRERIIGYAASRIG